MSTLPSLIVGGSIYEFSIFFLRLQLITTQFMKILKKSDPPDYNQPPNLP